MFTSIITCENVPQVLADHVFGVIDSHLLLLVIILMLLFIGMFIDLTGDGSHRTTVC